MSISDPFQYPSDRPDFFDRETENNQEEAHFYFTLNEFEELVEKYGIDWVLTKLRYPIYMRLFHHFESL